MSPEESTLRVYAEAYRRRARRYASEASALDEQANLLALDGVDLSPESLYAPCSLTRTALFGED